MRVVSCCRHAKSRATLSRRYLLRNTRCIPNIHASSREVAVPPAQKMAGPMIAVGRFVRGKRFDEVIALAEQIGPDRELLIVGDGPERTALQASADRAAIRVHFTGALAHREVLELLETASVLLSMSVSECWPNTIAEALAAGTPVVARDCNSGPREMITDGSNGYLIQSAADVAARGDIRAAFADVQTYASLCHNAREKARS